MKKLFSTLNALLFSLLFAGSLFAADVINDAPGVKTDYLKDCAGIHYYNSMLLPYDEDGVAASVNIDGDDYYFFNILAFGVTDTYVKGHRDGDVVTLPMNQYVTYDPSHDFGYVLGALKLILVESDGDEVPWYEYDPSITSMEYTVAADGSLALNLPGEADYLGLGMPEYVLGYYYSDTLEWAGYLEYKQLYVPFSDDSVRIPDGVDVTVYSFLETEIEGHKIDVAFDGDTLYLRGLSTYFPQATVRARIEGDKAYIKQDEFLGIYDDTYALVTKLMYPNPDADPNNSNIPAYLLAPADIEYCLEIAPDRKTIRAAANDDYLLCFNAAYDKLYYLDYFEDIRILYQDNYAGTPRNPLYLRWTNQWIEYIGFTDVRFYPSNISTDETLLDNSCLFYTIYVDGSPYMFEEHQGLDLCGDPILMYYGITEPTIYLPFGYNNLYDIYVYDYGLYDIGLYLEDIETVGVQMTYFYEGVTTVSDIVIYDIATGETTIQTPETPGDPDDSGIDNILTDEYANPSSDVYYDLNGRPVANPGHGIFIRNGKKVVI